MRYSLKTRFHDAEHPLYGTLMDIFLASRVYTRAPPHFFTTLVSRIVALSHTVLYDGYTTYSGAYVTHLCHTSILVRDTKIFPYCIVVTVLSLGDSTECYVRH